MMFSSSTSSFGKVLTAYCVTIGLVLAIAYQGLSTRLPDWSVPASYTGDALLILPLVQSQLERGSHWRCDRLGAPGIQELHDFPIVDHLHLALLWPLSNVWGPVTAFNVYHLLTYPLTALTSLYALRRLGLSLPAAMMGAILYALTPYHQLRGMAHYFLAAYWVIPLSLLVIVNIVENSLVPRGRWRWLEIVWIAVATASAGAYYAFFACALAAFAGVYAWLVQHSSRSARTAFCFVSAIGLFGIVNHLPSFLSSYKNGYNAAPHHRQPEESEEYSLKPIQMLLPQPEHPLPGFRRFQASYHSTFRPLENDNRCSCLGVMGSLGLIVAVVNVLLRSRTPLAVLIVFAVLLGVTGGLGSMYSVTISAQVRAYNRISIYIAFCVLLLICRQLDTFRLRRPTLGSLAIAIMTLIGVADQTPYGWWDVSTKRENPFSKSWNEDHTFYQQIEVILEQGDVFQLPMVPYPETFAVEQLTGYDPVRGYLHTKRLRWSFGAMRGREVDIWQRSVATLPPREMLRRLALRNFAALVFDRRGYSSDEADRLLNQLEQLLGPAKVIHADRQQFFWDLRDYVQQLNLSDEEKRAERERPVVLWLKGFYSFEKLGQEDHHRWCGPKGTALFVNPSDRPRRVRISFLPRTQELGFADVRIQSGIWNDRFPINRETAPREQELLLPPGRHAVHFTCRMPPVYLPSDSRYLSFFLAAFEMKLLD